MVLCYHVEMSVWIYALGSVFIVSAVSLVGAATLGMRRAVLNRLIFALVALAAGALFGDVFVHLLPELFEEWGTTLTSSLSVLAGIGIFFALEKFLRWHHSHEVHACVGEDCPETIQPFGYLVLASDGAHNFIDGLIIGASYLVGIPVGVATTIAVILHEIPQEIGDFGALLHSGFTVRRALFFNLLSALISVGGVAVAISLGTFVENVTDVVIGLAVGGFVYVAGSDLVPELQKENGGKSSAVQFLGLAAGMLVMVLLRVLE